MLQQASYGADFSQMGDFHLIHWKLIDPTQQQAWNIEHAEWADWDRQVRLIFTRAGQVWACRPEHYPQEAISLLDLNARRPDPKDSPEWANQWPAPE